MQDTVVNMKSVVSENVNKVFLPLIFVTNVQTNKTILQKDTK